MIRVILQGRTGNNLFQYAAGRALAQRHRTELILDGAWADQAHATQFQHLLRLPLKARYERRLSLLKRASNRFLAKGPAAFHRGPAIVESSEGNPHDLSQAADGSLLIGFFQSPRHFPNIETSLREELNLSTIILPANSLRFEEILRSRPTASIHVRRGDYLKIGNTQCLTENYHARAIENLRRQFNGIRFCVFSDDIPWCRTHFQGSEFLFCNFPELSSDSLHDLRLMAACHHHIIVNSSYSWWGAWLNPAESKQVIAPAMWMKKLASKQVVPSDWNLL